MAIISFSKTVREYEAGIKSCTRRDWCDRHFSLWQKWYDEGKLIHSAWSKSPRNGGKKLGTFRLTARPYREKLSDMPASDLKAEGGMCATLDEFYELIGLPPEKEVGVIRFERINKGKSWVLIIDDYCILTPQCWADSGDIIANVSISMGNEIVSGQHRIVFCGNGDMKYPGFSPSRSFSANAVSDKKFHTIIKNNIKIITSHLIGLISPKERLSLNGFGETCE